MRTRGTASEAERELHLQEKGRSFVEQFLAKLSLLLRGTTTAPAARFGESLQDEHAKGGSFALAAIGTPAPAPPDLPNATLRLYGGAQYNRAMAEFRCTLMAHCTRFQCTCSGDL